MNTGLLIGLMGPNADVKRGGRGTGVNNGLINGLRPPTTQSDVLTASLASLASQVVADGATAYWRMDDASGNLTDATGNGWTATMGAGFTYLQSPAGSRGIGNSINSNGTSGGNVGASLFNAAISAFTAEAWVKLTGTSHAYGIFGRDAGGGGTGGIQFRVESSGKLGIFFRSTANLITSIKTVNDGNWHHVVCTYGSSTAKLYIDSAIDTSTSVNVPATVNGNGSGNFVVFQAQTVNTSELFVGNLDEVAWYQGVTLTQQQVLNHYNAA